MVFFPKICAETNHIIQMLLDRRQSSKDEARGVGKRELLQNMVLERNTAVPGLIYDL